MNVVLLSPHFPAHMSRYAAQLQRLGVQVIGLADEPTQFLSRDVRAALDDYVCVSDMHHYEELVRACGQITWRHGKIDRIDSLNEYWLETEAALRTDFNVTGIKNDGIRQIKAKSEMKRLFLQHGIPCARGQVVETLQEALSFAREVGYPVVLKPDIGVGASDTWRADDEATLQRLFQQKPAKSFILEEYIAGEICTFDGLADRSGQPVFYTSMKYSRGVMEIVLEDDHICYYTLRQVPPDLEALGRRLLEIFDVRERFFHFEFFRTPDGRLVALEVNIRPPGGPSIDMMNFAHDLDLYSEWAHVLVHNHFNSPLRRKYFCGYAGRKHSKSYRHSHATIVDRLGERLMTHATLPAVFRRAMGDEYYLFRSESEDDLLACAALIQAENA